METELKYLVSSESTTKQWKKLSPHH
jgi:hypothetical protein